LLALHLNYFKVGVITYKVRLMPADLAKGKKEEKEISRFSLAARLPLVGSFNLALRYGKKKERGKERPKESHIFSTSARCSGRNSAPCVIAHHDVKEGKKRKGKRGNEKKGGGGKNFQELYVPSTNIYPNAL